MLYKSIFIGFLLLLSNSLFNFYSKYFNNFFEAIEIKNTCHLTRDSILPKNNLIVNGDFESGNIEFFSEYQYVTDTMFHGRYTITSNITELNKFLRSPPGGDHTSGKGNYMVVDSKIFRYSDRSKIWFSKPIKVIPNKIYIFSAWFFNVGGDGSSSPELQVSINNKPIEKSFKLPYNANQWHQIYYQWNSGRTRGHITLSIENIYYYQYIEDFAIDDICFGSI